MISAFNPSAVNTHTILTCSGGVCLIKIEHALGTLLALPDHRGLAVARQHQVLLWRVHVI